jgi:hypothetical protein
MSEQKKYYRTSALTIKQYDGSEAKTVGITDETQTVVALAVARPGRTAFTTKAQGSSQSRTLMYGDVSIHGFKKTGEHMEGDELVVDGELGAEIMESKSWLILQTKDPTTNEEREPFVRTPWDVRQVTQGNFGNLQPAVMNSALKLLADEAINLASEILYDKVERNEPIRSQAEYARAASFATQMASKLASRTTQRTQNTQPSQAQSSGLGDEAITSDDLTDEFGQ